MASAQVAEAFEQLSNDAHPSAERHSDTMQSSAHPGEPLEGGFRLKAFGAPVALSEALPGDAPPQYGAPVADAHAHDGGATLNNADDEPAPGSAPVDTMEDAYDSTEELVVKPLQSLAPLNVPPRAPTNDGGARGASPAANGHGHAYAHAAVIQRQGDDEPEYEQQAERRYQQQQPEAAHVEEEVEQQRAEHEPRAAAAEEEEEQQPPQHEPEQQREPEQQQAPEPEAEAPEAEAEAEAPAAAAAAEAPEAPRQPRGSWMTWEAANGGAVPEPEPEPEPEAAPAARPAVYQPPPRAVTGVMGVVKGSVVSHGASINPDAEVVRCTDTVEEVRTSSVRVTEMSKQLKEHFEHGMPFGGKPPEKEPSAGAVTPRTAGKAGAACLKQHDLVNTANVALVLQAGEFTLKPGVDVVPYAELKELRLEDGLDVSRKEEYLSEAEFEQVFGMDKEDFRAMPPWKRINAKKAKGLF